MRFLQDLVDLIRGKKVLKVVENTAYFERKKQQGFKKFTDNIIKNLKKKIKSGEKIRVCFSVIYDSTFPAENVFKKMLEDDIFEPFILVIPDQSYGKENMFYQMKKTYNTLSSKYEQVFNSYDYEKKEFIDWSRKMDICFFANPYDVIVHKFYSVKYLFKKAICMYVPYFMTATSYIKTFSNIESLAYMYKIFVDSMFTKKIFLKNTIYANSQIQVSGFPRTDDLANIEDKNRKLKIVIALHSYSRENNHGIEFSEFINFYDTLVELPEKYPDIHFVFRPHPLLFVILEKENIWSKEQIEEYRNKWQNYTNVTYQDGGDFAYDFINSDGIIQDCGSFLPEYMLTEHPVCYMQTKRETYKNSFVKIGQQCLDNSYIASHNNDIFSFVDEVILAGNDSKRKKRLEFVKNNLKVNFGHVSDYIVKRIKDSVG